MKRVLITGGNGYIGAYLYRALTSYNIQITSRKQNTSSIFMELLDSSTIKDVCKDIDYVVHLANLDERLVKQQPKEALLANSYATRELYLDAANNGVRKFIYFSTFHVYGVSDGEIDESTHPKPKSDYGLTHYFAEQYLEQLSAREGVPVAVIRLTNGIGAPYGQYKWYLALNDFCKTAFETGRIVLKSNGLPQRDFVPIKDVVTAVRLLVEREQDKLYEVYNVSSEKTYSIRELALSVAEVCRKRYGKEVELEIPGASKYEIEAVKPLHVSSQKIRKLGWLPKFTLDEVINDIFDMLESS